MPAINRVNFYLEINRVFLLIWHCNKSGFFFKGSKMEWSDLSVIIGSSAPVLGNLIAGPAGAAVGKLVAHALEVDDHPDTVSAALMGHPEAVSKLQELQANARVQLEQLAVTVEQTRLQSRTAQYLSEVGDRDSARKLAASQLHDWVRPTVTLGLLLGAVAIIVFVFTGQADNVLKDTTASLSIGTIIGYWFNELKQTLAFWFGTTRDGSVQTQAITQFAVRPGLNADHNVLQTHPADSSATHQWPPARNGD
jgi:hypothetical protein